MQSAIKNIFKQKWKIKVKILKTPRVAFNILLNSTGKSLTYVC